MTRAAKQSQRWQQRDAKYLIQPQAHRVIDGRRVWLRGWYANLRTSYLRSIYNEALALNKRSTNETLPQYLMRHGMLERSTAA